MEDVPLQAVPPHGCGIAEKVILIKQYLWVFGKRTPYTFRC